MTAPGFDRLRSRLLGACLPSPVRRRSACRTRGARGTIPLAAAPASRRLTRMDESSDDPFDGPMESVRACPRCQTGMVRASLGVEGSVVCLLEGRHLAGVVLHSCPCCLQVELEAVP